jgi:gluconokinase
MNLLCFDISSGGISAAVFDSQLTVRRIAETQWHLESSEAAAADLQVAHVLDAFRNCIRKLDVSDPGSVDAICIGTFLHSCLLLDADGEPLSPVFTWLDKRGQAGVVYIRARMGERYHSLTGCRYHPMFPAFKIAMLRVSEPRLLDETMRIVSIKALLLNRLTGSWIEDYGTASASGLFNIVNAEWDPELLALLGLDSGQFPAVTGATAIAAQITDRAAEEFGLAEGIPLIVGSGDGFLANVGTGCELPSRIAVTLGTSGVVRQTLNRPVVDSSSGTFCYRAGRDAYLIGCAGSNGGNVLDWGRRVLGTLENAESSEDPPIFIPLLHGERSPDWNPHLTASWHQLSARHTSADLARSVLEGVVFNLAHFLEIVQQTSHEAATDIVLSGNGFLHPLAAPTLAKISGIATWMPPMPGLASLRGAAICALRAFGQPVPVLNLERVSALNDAKLTARYADYRQLRQTRPQL